MQLLNLRIQNFRNIDFAELDLSADRIFLLGENAGQIQLAGSFGTTDGAAFFPDAKKCRFVAAGQ